MIGKITKFDGPRVTASALRTLEIEKDGLAALSDAFSGVLAETFGDAVELIGRLEGKVIVTGVGKNSHIGAKIAATLASTGTPAFFVHAAEANHGDLGMITANDVILALSWSGQTTELQGIIAFSRRFDIPLVAITAGETSALAMAADIVLLLPKKSEACPHGLAPTTSALMQLAIGDALALSLLEARGFTPEDFKTFHPGGKLGAVLTHVSEVMHTGDAIPLVKIGTSVPEAAMVLSHKRFGCVGVVDENERLLGIMTNGDIARHMEKPLQGVAVETIMTRTPKTIRPDTLAVAAMAMLNDHNISALLVMGGDEKVVGIVHFHDLLRIGVA
ncbi:SIS domain-containing protein [Rhizobium sp. L1K21]|uniref:KpsF/GutQ family sugar-phosphate isomerase n=1 Tax=Rhizobium sp. L1K21 TaxID=2954933 RepID=UPI0020938123|nr:KpsF/GutQ family sugar-phosphate isomerase [Rhizobium sp. L1K21]MCO6185033.1 KpsF/GutQ family sugar-phosphate isomerase [Rhizobium sp. L1K21]